MIDCVPTAQNFFQRALQISHCLVHDLLDGNSAHLRCADAKYEKLPGRFIMTRAHSLRKRKCLYEASSERQPGKPQPR